MNQNIHNSDFRLMMCQNDITGLSYFVVYPAPESRELNLFGVSGRTNVLSANFVSDNLILAQFKYRDIIHKFAEKATVIKEEKYWSAIDQNGKLKEMPLKVEKDSSIIFHHLLESGCLVIFNDKTNLQIRKFNLRGELVFKSTFEDEKLQK